MRLKPIDGPPYFKTGIRKQKKHRLIDEPHLDFIRGLPCLACAGRGGVAHHLTIGRNRAGRRAGDDQAVPMTSKCHNDFPQSLHMVGERKFWNSKGLDPRPVAKFLFENTGDHAKCVTFIREAQAGAAINLRRGVVIFPMKDDLLPR